MGSSEHQYWEIFEAVADGLLLLEQTAAGLRVLVANPAAAALLEVPAGAPDLLIDPDAVSPFASHLTAGSRGCLASNSTLATECELQGAGSSSTYRSTFTPVHDDGAEGSRVAVLIRDVTEEQRLQNMLHGRAEEFRALVENAPDFISRYDTQGRILYNNPAIERLGRPIEEIRGRTSLEVAPDSPSAARFHECVLEVARTAAPTQVELSVESYVPGQVARHQVRFVPERDEQGNVVSVLGIGRDITEIRNNEAKTRALAEHLALAADVAQLGIVSLDLATEQLWLDERARAIFGFAPDTVVTLAMSRAAVLPEDLPRLQEISKRALAMGISSRSEFRIRRPDGEIRWLEMSSSPECTAGTVTSKLSVYRDVTERVHVEQQRRRLEAQLRQAQKLEAIGTLAAGIAHDFNNILSAILGNVALLKQDLEPSHSVQASVIEIDKAAKRGKELVQRLLAFGRPQHQRYDVVRLQNIVDEVVKLLGPTLPKTVDLRIERADEAPPVRIDVSQIEQVLMNLCVNAYQAMTNRKGRILIGIEVREVDECMPPLALGRYVVLSVSDNGSGIAPEVLEHIFEPFYTTKPAGEGTGLGLAIVHGIVRSHGGTVTVESGARGTTFCIYLPAVTDEAKRNAFESSAQQRPIAKGEGQRILYVDDEEALVLLAQRVFERTGYRPRCFSDPQAAIAAFRAEPEQYDLVITDLSMPGTSGIEVAKAVLAIDPHAKVVLTSGYLRPSDVEAARTIGIRDLILKPNTVEEMTLAVQRLLAC